MLLNETLEISWNKRNKAHYIARGYTFTRIGDSILANICDVQMFARTDVDVLCAECSYAHKVSYRTYNSKMNLYGKYMCKNCTKLWVRTNKDNKDEAEESVAKYIINRFGDTVCDPLEVFWSELNDISPWKVPRGTRTTYYFTCQYGHPPYKTKPLNFLRGHRCPYCVGQRAVPENSFASFHMQNTCEKFTERFWDTGKNDVNPYELTAYSASKVWIKCIENSGHGSYFVVASQFSAGRRCPKCAQARNESHLQEKVRKYISEELGYEVRHEEDCTLVPINPRTKYPLPFDNEVVALKLVVEVHGKQHFEECPYLAGWDKMNLTPKEALKKRKLYDRYKQYVAFCSGYEYLVVPYSAEKGNAYKDIIKHKIDSVLSNKT